MPDIDLAMTLHPLEQHLQHVFASLVPTGQLFYVAYSGGADSSALLHAAHRLLAASPAKQLRAWHINHGLVPEASQWEAHCRRVCGELEVPLEVSCVKPSEHAHQSEEMFARNARYAIWQDRLPPASFLLQAHHLDDQAETLLLQLMRGRAQGMPVMRPLTRHPARSDAPILIRPFLNLPKTSIDNYIAAKSLAYVADPSNRALQHDRSYIRHKVLPLLSQRWPGVVTNLGRAADQLATDQHVLSMDRHQLLQQHLTDGRLRVDVVRALKQKERAALIIAWLTHLRLALPPHGILTQLARQLNAKQDATPVLEWKGGCIRRYRDHLYALRPLPELDANWQLRVQAKRESSYALPLGVLHINKVVDKGMREDALPFVVGYASRYQSAQRNGFKLRLAGRGGHRPLKKFLQEAGLPPWLRPYMPIIYCNQEVAAVANVGVTQGSLASGEGEWNLHGMPLLMG